METIGFKLGFHTSMRFMQRTNQSKFGLQSWVLDVNMENHGALHFIMDGINV
jgi:hypothetical protein